MTFCQSKLLVNTWMSQPPGKKFGYLRCFANVSFLGRNDLLPGAARLSLLLRGLMGLSTVGGCARRRLPVHLGGFRRKRRWRGGDG